jgi:hypothetical protein
VIRLSDIKGGDPVERVVADALTEAGIDWDIPDHPITLDFKVKDGPYIECKRFHAPRVVNQMAQAEDVIVIQGMAAAKWFAANLGLAVR